MAGSRTDLDEVLRLCADIGNVHITPYSGDAEGITVGTPHPDADDISSLLAKVRSANSVLKCANKEGPLSVKIVKQAISGKFPEKIDAISETIVKKSDATAEITRLEERASILEIIAPLDIPLELMTEISSVDVYIGETTKASKANQVFGELRSRIEMHIVGNVIAVACQGKEAAEVQMAMGELGVKPIQIPSGKGKPSELLAQAMANISKSQKIVSEYLNYDLPNSSGEVRGNDETRTAWLGPDEFLIQCTEDKTYNIINELDNILSNSFFSVTDVSDYYLTIRLSGKKSIEVLTKGCPLNFKKYLNAKDTCAQSYISKATVFIDCLAEDQIFDISVRWSFAEYLWDWLKDASLEFSST